MQVMGDSDRPFDNFESFKIRRTTFLIDLEFADLLILRL